MRNGHATFQGHKQIIVPRQDHLEIAGTQQDFFQLARKAQHQVFFDHLAFFGTRINAAVPRIQHHQQRCGGIPWFAGRARIRNWWKVPTGGVRQSGSGRELLGGGPGQCQDQPCCASDAVNPHIRPFQCERPGQNGHHPRPTGAKPAYA